MDVFGRLGVALPIVAAMVAAAAIAQPSEPSPDPALPTSLAVVGVGAVTTVAGAIVAATDGSECAMDPCHRNDVWDQQAHAAALIGAGVGLMTAGGLFAAAVQPPDEGETRASEGRMVGGILVTSLGVAAAGIGAGALALEQPRGAVIFLAFPASAALLAIGIPLLATGARSPSREEIEDRDRRQRIPHHFLSPALMWTGGFMVVTGGALVVASVAIATSCDRRPGDDQLACFGAGFTGMLVGVTGGSVHATGAVLLGVGSVRMPDEALPTVAIGPTGGSLQWSFE